MNKFVDGLLHILGLFIELHDLGAFRSVSEVGGIDFGWDFQAEDVALFPGLDKDFGVFPFPGQVVADGFECVQVMAGEIEPLL